MVKNLPANTGAQEMWVQSLCRKDSMEKEMVIHSSILARVIPWTKEPGKLQSIGSQKVGHDRAHTHMLFHWHVSQVWP